MKRKFTIPWIFLTILTVQSFAKKKITEGSIIYNIIVNTNDAAAKIADGFDGATNTIYIKGKLNRSELVSVFGTQSTIINGKTGNVTVLKEYGDKKYLINMTPSEWTETNK